MFDGSEELQGLCSESVRVKRKSLTSTPGEEAVGASRSSRFSRSTPEPQELLLGNRETSQVTKGLDTL